MKGLNGFISPVRYMSCNRFIYIYIGFTGPAYICIYIQICKLLRVLGLDSFELHGEGLYRLGVGALLICCVP